jgi:hypothetical protein
MKNLIFLLLIILIKLNEEKLIKKQDYSIKANTTNVLLYKNTHLFITTMVNTTNYVFRFPISVGIVDSFIVGGIDFIIGDFGYGRYQNLTTSYFCKVDLINFNMTLSIQTEFSYFVVNDQTSFYLFGFLKEVPGLKLGGVSRYSLTDFSVIYKNSFDTKYYSFISGVYDPSNNVIWTLRTNDLVKYRVIDGSPIFKINLLGLNIQTLKKISINTDTNSLFIYGDSFVYSVNTSEVSDINRFYPLNNNNSFLSTFSNNNLYLVSNFLGPGSNSYNITIYNTTSLKFTYLTKKNVNNGFNDFFVFEGIEMVVIKGDLELKLFNSKFDEQNSNINFFDLFENQLPQTLIYNNSLYFQTYPFQSGNEYPTILVVSDLNLTFQGITFKNNTLVDPTPLVVNPNVYLFKDTFFASTSKFIFKFNKNNNPVGLVGLTKFDLKESFSQQRNIFFDDVNQFLYFFTEELPTIFYKLNMNNLTLVKSVQLDEGVDSLNYCTIDILLRRLICIRSVAVNSDLIIFDIDTLDIKKNISIDCSSLFTNPIIDKIRNSIYFSCLNNVDQPILLKYNLADFSKNNSIEVLSKDSFVVSFMKMDLYSLYLTGRNSKYILRIDLDQFKAIDYINYDTNPTYIGPFEIFDNNYAYVGKFGDRGSLVIGTIECPKGTYSSNLKYPCTPCVAGTYSTLIGSNSINNCISCPLGYYSNVIYKT